MSVAWYIVLEREIPGFDHGVDARALSRAVDDLEAMAKEAGFQSLLEFFSISPEEAAGIVGDSIQFPPEEWFSAGDGLAAVRALSESVESTKVEHADKIVGELKTFERVLEVAAEHGVRWHLAMDI